MDSKGLNLPLSSLCLLVPPIRLMSASMWQVAEQRNVMQYGKLEEFVTLVTEMVPELLSSRQRTQLILGLRARLVLELCCGKEDMVDHQTIQRHLDRIQSCTVKHKASKNKRVEASKSNFVELVQTLLEDPAKREHFFQEVFPVQYGTKYDTALQILVWEFFSRLEELLPVPSFTQTASCLSLAFSDLEECVQSVSDPEHLKTLLQHQRHLGHLNRDHLFYDSDTILSALSLTSLVNSKQTSVEARGHDTRKKEQEGGEEWRPEISYNGTYKGTDEGVERLEEAGESSSGQQKPGSSLHAHPVAVDEPDSDMPSQVFSCPQCPFSHRREVNLQQHIRKEHLTEEDSRSLDSGGAENSLPSNQTIQRPSIKTTKKYICFKCGKGFRSPSDLKRHKGVHTDMQPFHCNQCDKRFKAKGSLKQHQRVHSGERPYDCSHCGRGFRTSDILKSHLRIHTGERPYGCTICGKRFIQRQVLTRHIRMHSGEKPYLCSICGKTFACSGELMVHSRIHTGERPYHCEQCGNTFSLASKLKVHQRSHTGERPYPCTQCPKGFSTSNRLVKHMRIHTGEKPYPCVKCGKRFSERGNMRIHQRMHEKERKGRQMY
ncbi:zinc finger protein 485-like [Salvelinus fontinalis]|uniref:zinc finger protein 485-like n=1 Tax=Salvelinus fontinalis TaxID=8038 RepID=UPI00248583F9|nr:zinc finger protein 485-like [Salvelinus fontinalis]